MMTFLQKTSMVMGITTSTTTSMCPLNTKPATSSSMTWPPALVKHLHSTWIHGTAPSRSLTSFWEIICISRELGIVNSHWIMTFFWLPSNFGNGGGSNSDENWRKKQEKETIPGQELETQHILSHRYVFSYSFYFILLILFIIRLHTRTPLAITTDDCHNHQLKRSVLV